jgi:hypothetical protein
MEVNMKMLSLCAAAALALLSATPTAASVVDIAQEAAKSRPPLMLSGEQKAAVAQAVARENSYQPTPDGFEPRVGAAVSKKVVGHPLPRPLIYEIDALKEYTYAKLDRNVLILDPMSGKVADIVPRVTPASGIADMKPAEWAATRGREMLGLPPTSASVKGKPAAEQAASGPVHERRAVRVPNTDGAEDKPRAGSQR